MAIDAGAISTRIRPILGALKTTQLPVYRSVEPRPPAVPFITISRQVGGGAWTLAQRLVHQLNHDQPSDQPWTCWDRELVEKVAKDHHMSHELVESLENSSRLWLRDFFSGFASSRDWLNEEQVFQRVATTIRALAQAGKVVIVGRGGVHITRNMPGGIHVRLVAPLEKRIEYMADYLHVSRDAAAEHIRRTDRNREAFHKRYWPNQPMVAEMFTLTINSGLVEEAQAIQLIRALLPASVPAAVPAS
jgi:cytidylate kinase